MGGVDAMLNKGFNLIKESLIAFCKEISGDKDIDLKALEGTLVKFKPQWGQFIDRIQAAAELTSHERYLGWFKKEFRGTKHFPSPEDDDSSRGSMSSEDSASDYSTSTISSSHAIPTRVPCSSAQFVPSTTMPTSLRPPLHSRG